VLRGVSDSGQKVGQICAWHNLETIDYTGVTDVSLGLFRVPLSVYSTDSIDVISLNIAKKGEGGGGVCVFPFNRLIHKTMRRKAVHDCRYDELISWDLELTARCHDPTQSKWRSEFRNRLVVVSKQRAFATWYRIAIEGTP